MRRNVDYREGETLWRDTIAKRPANPLAHHMLAETLDRRGDTAGAIAHYEAALHANPSFPEAHNNLGAALLESGRRDEAIAHYEVRFEDQRRSRARFSRASAKSGASRRAASSRQ